MIVYSVTVKIEAAVHDDWLAWVRDVHIPDVLATGFFVDHRMLRLMEDDARDGITYNIQYRARSMSDILTYQEEVAPRLQKDHTERYDGRYVAFRTLLREV